jgi:DNA-binding MarR family transcriptional regulator
MPLLLLKDLPRYECLLESAKEFPDLDPSAAEAYLHLLRAGDDAFGVSERNLDEHGISQGRFCVLMLLWRRVHPRAADLPGAAGAEAGPRTPAELAAGANVTRATMTGLIDTLERDGFVKREPDPDDRRMMSVRLTPKADEFLREFLPGHFRTTAKLMGVLTEAERKTLVRLLTKISAQAAAMVSPVASSAPTEPAAHAV